MAETSAISGTLTKKDVQKLVDEARAGSVGPTALYYAGVTAPAISAGTALITRRALIDVGVDSYWVLMWASIVAAMTGITWYLIFIRWSNSQKAARSADLETATEVRVTSDALILRRGKIETRVDWAAVSDVRTNGPRTIIFIDGAAPVMVPHSWFENDMDRDHFLGLIEQRAEF